MLLAFAGLSTTSYQTASALPSCGYIVLVGLSLSAPALVSQRLALIWAFRFAARVAYVAASAASPSVCAREAARTSTPYSSALAAMFSPPCPSLAQSLVPVTFRRPLPSILFVMNVTPRLNRAQMLSSQIG